MEFDRTCHGVEWHIVIKTIIGVAHIVQLVAETSGEESRPGIITLRQDLDRRDGEEYLLEIISNY